MYTCRECENEINLATEPAVKPSLPKILIRWGMLLGILLAAIGSFLWFIAPGRWGNPTAQGEGRAVESLREDQTALRGYATARNGCYPRQLDELGEPVRSAAELAQRGNYQIQYTPGPVGTDGLIHAYVLQARAGNYGLRNFYINNSGFMRVTRENRDATAQDSLYQR
jgi:hypothetical protein